MPATQLPEQRRQAAQRGTASQHQRSREGSPPTITAGTSATGDAGVDIKDGKPTKWKIENSWGTENHGMKTGNNGYFVCSDEWFDNFVYEVAIRKDRLSPEMQKALDSDPIVWPFWNTFNPVSA